MPKHLDKHGTGVIAWHCFISDGEVRLAETAIAQADVRSQSDYAFIVPIAKKLYAPEATAEILADLALGAEQGRHISTSRNQAKVPPAFMDLHIDLALRTL